MRGPAIVLACLSAVALTACGGQSQPPTPPGPVKGLPYMKIGQAAGTPVGAVILIHGGGWHDTGPAQLAPLTAIAQHLNAMGWNTFNTDYRPYARSLPDVEAVYDYVHKQLGPSRPICALGSSAGANLALLLAAARPQLACVMSYAGPTDLTVLDKPSLQIYLPVHALAQAVNGNLAAWSPLKMVSKIHAKTFLAYATNDPLVPLSQAEELHAALPGSELVVLGPGTRGFIHSYVNSSELDATYAAQDRLLEQVAAVHH
jgi:acetyl esterase/lipase